MELIEKTIEELVNQGKLYLGSPEKVEELIDSLNKTNKKDIEGFDVLVSIVKDVLSGKLNNVNYESIERIIATLIYLANPDDLIPDCIPSTGLVDDQKAIDYCLNKEAELIKRYKGA